MLRQRANLKVKLPDINKSIEAVAMLKKRSLGDVKEVETHFLISDNIWAKSTIPNNTGKVGLWLGANVMVEYSHDDALKLLLKNQKNAEEKLAETTADCDYVRDQITTIEVNMARVYNQGVANKQKEKAK